MCHMTDTGQKQKSASLCSTCYVCCKCGTTHIYCCVQCCGFVLLRHQPGSNRSISPACQAHSNKPAAHCHSRQMGQTDEQMDNHCTVTQTILCILCTQCQQLHNNHKQIVFCSYKVVPNLNIICRVNFT